MSNRALLIYTNLSTFVKGDAGILSKNYNVTHFKVNNKTGFSLILSLTYQLFYLLFNIRKFRFVYIWFADYHSLIPTLIGRLFGVKVFLVIGGYDICREKRWKYGSFTNAPRAFFTINSIRNASTNLCVSKNIERIVRRIAPKANTSLLYNGITLDKNIASKEEEIQYDFLCVALVSTTKAFYIKGIDRYNSLAQMMPDRRFLLIGCSESIFRQTGIKPSGNIDLLPKIEHNALVGYYKSSHVYCQLSRRESFSLSLAEAMSYGCVPLISNTGGMPEVTGNLGFIANGDDMQNIADLAKKAITQNRSSEYSERIYKNFTISVREASLNKILATIL